jgi:hypothetical protein
MEENEGKTSFSGGALSTALTKLSIFGSTAEVAAGPQRRE